MMSPSVISTVRLTIRIAVVLPHPDGPTRTQISPAGTSSVRSSTAGASAPGYRFVTCSYRTAEAVACGSGTRARSYTRSKGRLGQAEAGRPLARLGDDLLDSVHDTASHQDSAGDDGRVDDRSGGCVNEVGFRVAEARLRCIGSQEQEV